MAYAVIELRTLVKLLRRTSTATAHEGIPRVGLRRRAQDPRRRGGARPVVGQPGSIPRDEPVIVLSRHCGPGDSVLVAWLLIFVYRLQVRIVLKAVLRYEPVLDFAGNGDACASGPRRARPSTDSRSRRVARRRAGAAAVSRRCELHLAAVALPRSPRIRKTGGIRAAGRALRRSYTLPPRAGGATAAVSGAPAPTSLCSPTTALPRRAGPALVAAADPPATARPHDPDPGRPTSPSQLGPWLERTWTKVDAWVADHTERS